MRRFHAVTPFILLLTALLALSACGGGNSSSSDGVSSITITPSPVALSPGSWTQVTAIALDSKGIQVTKVTPTFSVASGGDLVSVSVNGFVCAGQWDSLTTPIRCTPPANVNGNPPYGKATIAASVGTVTSATPAIVDVVPPVDNITISAAPIVDPDHPDTSGLDCVSQSGTANTRTYTATASHRGIPIDLSKITDAITWNIDASTIGAIASPKDSSGNVDTRSGVVTALIPGRTQVSATLGGLRSLPVDYTTCPVSQIRIEDSNHGTATPDASPLAAAGTTALTLTLIDSRGNTVNLAPTYTNAAGDTVTVNLSLAWASSQPLVASASTTSSTTSTTTGGTTTSVTTYSGTITANAHGGTSTVFAACASPNCNAGLGSVYSNAYVAKVANTNTTTAYIGSKNSKNIYPITTSDNKLGTAIALTSAPNSMMFDKAGASLYVGTDTGLIVVTQATNTPSGVFTGAPGRVLNVSPDGSTVLVSNVDLVTDKTKSQLFVYMTSTGAIQTLNIPGATAARFAPDGSKAYIVGNGNWTVYTPGVFPVPQSLAGASSAAFLASGSVAYITDASGLDVHATCNDRFEPAVPAGAVAPTLIEPLPDGIRMLSLGSPDLNLVTAATAAPIENWNKGFLSATTGCAPAVSNNVTTTTALNGGAAFTPAQLIVTSDGSKAFAPSGAGKLTGASISGDTITPVAVDLKSVDSNNTAQPAQVAQTTGGATLDGKQLYIGGADNQVHHIDLTVTPPVDNPIKLKGNPTGSNSVSDDFTTTDFVAVRPQ